MPSRSVIASAFAVALAACSAASARGAEPRSSDLVETSQVDVVEAWPFVVRAKKNADAAHCRGLGPAALRVTENGVEVQVLAVNGAPPLSTHVLLIDTSSSMTSDSHAVTRKRGRQAKAAAQAYVNWVFESAARPGPAPPRRPDLMLLTFDDDLVMRVPPTSISDAGVALRVIDSIRSIGGGYLTGLNDAVYRTVDFLATREGRSVVILLSDGIDRDSRRTSEEVERLTQRANNVTLFAIGIGLRGAQYERFIEFLERLARSTGGRYFGVWGAPGNLAARLDGRFGEIQRRLASQLYASWLTTARPDDPADPTTGAPAVEVRIQSRDRRCVVPKDGYRPLRAVTLPSDPTPASDGAGQPAAGSEDVVIDTGDVVGAHGSLELTLQDIVLDDDPLVSYPGDGDSKAWAERRVRLEIGAFGATERNGHFEPEATLHRWLVDGRLPALAVPGSFPTARDTLFPVDGEINGKRFLDLRDALARVIHGADPAYRDWALERARQRIRARFERLLPPPETPAERRDYDRRLDLVVSQRVAAMGSAAYRDDLAGWLGDIAARALADRLERFEANRLLAAGTTALPEVDRAQRAWLRLHDWLRIPDRVRVTVPLELTCRGDDGPCGFHRIVFPRIGDLPEDLTRPTGKTLEPPSFEQFLEYERLKVPRRPFGLMTVRWLLGFPAEPQDSEPPAQLPAPAGALRDGWHIAELRHRPEPLDGKPSHEAPRCLRWVRLDLERAAATARLELLVEATLEPGESPRALPDACEALPGPVRLLPRCYRLELQADGEGAAGLGIDGIHPCP